VNLALDRGCRFNFTELRKRAKTWRLDFAGATAGGGENGGYGCAENKKDAGHGLEGLVDTPKGGFRNG